MILLQLFHTQEEDINKYQTFFYIVYENQRRNFSLVARYSFKFTHCLLLVVKSLIARYKIYSLLVVEVALCKKLLATRCKSYSLQNITHYSLQNSLVTHCRSCSLQKITRYSLQNSLVTRCRCCSLQNSLVNPYRSCLLQKVSRYLLQNLLVARCKNSLITHYSLQKFLVSKNHSPPVAKICLLLVAKFACYSLQKLLCPKITGFSLQHSLNTHSKKSCFVKTSTSWNYCLFKVN